MIYRVTTKKVTYLNCITMEPTNTTTVGYCGPEIQEARIAYHTAVVGDKPVRVGKDSAVTTLERLDEEGLADTDVGVMVLAEVPKAAEKAKGG